MTSALFGKTEDKKTPAAKKPAPVKVVGSAKPDEKEKASMKDLYGAGGAAKAGSAKKGKEGKKLGNAFRVLVKPLVTEKASVLGVENKYFFEVAPKTNKIEIAKAIFEVYGVKPVKVNIVNLKGKKVRYGRTMGERKGKKKAVVTLPEGKTINVYEGV